MELSQENQDKNQQEDIQHTPARKTENEKNADEKEEVKRRKALRSILSASTLLVINPFVVGADSGKFFVTVTPTPSTSSTPTPTPSTSPTPTPSSSSPAPSSSPTPTPSTSASPTPTPSSSPTPTPSNSSTPTPTPTPSNSSTPTPTPSSSPTPTPSSSATPTPTPTPSSSSEPLPVEISEFGVRDDDGIINLYWRTESEQQNRGFEIQRSTDSFMFTRIGWVEGVGNSSKSQFYTFEELDVEANRWYYYRLKQVDFNGTSHLSKTVAIMLNEEARTTLKKISPSVITQNYVNVEITAGNIGTAEIAVVNLQGQKISQRSLSLRKGYNSLRMELTNASSGLYSVQMRLASGEVQSRRFMVQR